MPDPLKRIVIAEDDPAIGTMLLKVLSQFYDVVVTNDGASAVAAARKLPPPDLLLLDVMMPGMDGMEVCRRVRQELALPELIIVFVTALSDRDSRMRAKAAGANDFLVKPVDSFELTFRAHQWLKLGHLRDLTERGAELQQGLLALSRAAGQIARELGDAARASDGESSAPALTQAAEQLAQISTESQRLATHSRQRSVPPHGSAPLPAASEAAPRNHQP
jgi:CheY-like chemotaxis protein